MASDQASSSTSSHTLITSIINGIPFHPEITRERIDELRHFPLRDDDLYIVTYPKSGTTWTQQIVKLIRLNGQDNDKLLREANPWLERVEDVDAAKVLPFPRTFKSHTPYHMMPGGDPRTSPAKYIYVARNPRDVAVSMFYHFKRLKIFEFTGDWNCFFELFMEGKVESGMWFDHVLEWWENRDAANIIFLKYEDMMKDPKGAINTVAQFMGCSLTPAVVDLIHKQSSFEHMKEDPALVKNFAMNVREGSTSFFRKGIVGDWRNHFSNEQCQRLDQEYTKRMTETGLEFLFTA